MNRILAFLASTLVAGCATAPEDSAKTDRPIPPAIAYEPRIKNSTILDEELPKLRAKAAAGDTWSQGRLAYVIAETRYEDRPQAETWARKAAEAGDVQAQALLGEWLTATDDPKRLEEGVKWTRMAAEKCYPGAEYDMGVLTFHGRAGGPADREEARYWFARSHAHGHPNAAQTCMSLLDPPLIERLIPASFDRWVRDRSWEFNHGGTPPPR